MRMYVEPFGKPRLMVSRTDDDRILVLSKIFAVEKIVFYREGTVPRISCMGPTESWKR